MTAAKLQAKLMRHNVRQVLLGTVLTPIAAVLWWLDFLAFRLIAYGILHPCGVERAWEIASVIGAACVGLIAIEGLTTSHEAFDVMDYTLSDFNWRGGGGRLDPLSNAWWVLQIVLLAPRTTVLAYRSFRSVILTNTATIDRAAEIFAALEADRHWCAASEFGECDDAVRLLARLRLIWCKGAEDGLEIRFPAASTEEELV